ncbi:MAG TPA: threonine/serine exporter family protein [Gemmatimonas sp.]|nr:threonine/serine exporter family protein [Gemmatimonas sp.]
MFVNEGLIGRETLPSHRAATSFVLELAKALHAYGTPAHQLEAQLSQVAGRLGITAEFFSTPTSIMIGFGPLINQQVHLLRVEPGETNLGHLALLGDITREVSEHRLSPADGLDRLRALIVEPPRWAAPLRLVAFVLSSAAVACFLRLSAADVLVASLLGLLTGCIVLFCRRRPALTHVTEPLAAFLVTTLALSVDVLTRAGSGYLTSLAGLVILLPGLTFTLALTELSTRQLASGTARLSGAIVVFLGLGFGLALGAKLGTFTGTELRALLPAADIAALALTTLPPWVEWLALLVAPLSFMVLLNAKARDAGWIIVACVAAYVTSRVTSASMGEELGAFLGAFVVSAGSNLLGRFLKRTPIVTVVPGLLILVPGSIGFRSVTSMLGQEFELGVSTAFRVAIVGISLAAGILAGNVVASGALRRKVLA